MKYQKGNTRYFNTIDTLQKAYYVGLLAADGYMYNYRGCKGFTIDLTIADSYILEGLAKEIGTDKILNTYHNDKSGYALQGCNVKPRRRFAYYSEDTFNDLHNLGLTQKKTHTIGRVIDNIPDEFKVGFILGYIDGDGSISSREEWRTKNKWKTKFLIRTFTVQMRGTKDMLESILENIPTGKNCKVNKAKSMYRLGIGNKATAEFLLENYNKLTYCIERKRNKLREFLI